ncbi:GNAT family N-acetyltransferase [Frigidibacter sp. ROC022]|uniref:GNAT family N-acetyltransferase n=1 Tax=Frigidibacter sp. ROC022 TaxID=2971796 RepID=UPI00215B16B1|nr:GNAT family N-acetyltransferase [Frigidibacter sp. ROC022]MCR8722973.1 GNAT family N-acetyltransferase [Frigidibacter sp. ROC022]
MIRPARAEDVPALLALWNPVIRDTIVTFSSEEKTADSLSAMIAARHAAGRAFFVAEVDGVAQGLATYDQFRGGNGYAHAMEHTVILADAARGRGLGRALVAAVEDHARAAGHHAMMAGVSAENAAGVAFHGRLGYREVGRLPEVGRKFGRWLDLVLMQKLL